MNFVQLAAWVQTAPTDLRSRPDWGFVAVVIGLVFAAIQAHRFWRQTIRLEDQLVAMKKDQAFTYEQYRDAFKALRGPAALVERGTSLVTQATPGWVAEGMPAIGSRLAQGDEGLREAWSALPAPAADGTVSTPVQVVLGGRSLEVVPLAGASLGLLLVQPR